MVTETLSILIETIFKNAGIQNATQQIRFLEKQVSSIGKTIGGGSAFDLTQQLGLQQRDFVVNNELLKKYGLYMVEGEKSLKSFATRTADTGEGLSKLTKAFASGEWEKNKQNLITNVKAMQRLGLGAEESRAKFKMWYLSLMFFGMMIQRTFSRLATTTLNSYMKITEGTTSASQGIMVLTAAWETLKYSIGSAIAETLEPLIPMILDIITKIQDWVDAHPELTAKIIFLGFIIGSLMFLIGQFGLGINGVIQSIQHFINFILVLGKVFSKFVLPIIGDLGLGSILVLIALIIIAIALLVAAWKTNFAGIREFVSNELWIIGSIFKLVFDFIINLFKDFVMIFEGLFEGDIDKIWYGIQKLGNDIFVFLLKLVLRIVALIGNIGIFIVRAVSGILATLIKLHFSFQEQIEKVFVRIKWAIVEAFEIAVNWVINKILNPLIKKLSGITIFGEKPFGWLEGFEIKPVEFVGTRRTDELESISKRYDAIAESADKVNDVVQDNLDYIGKDAIAWADEAIDSQNKFAVAVDTVGTSSSTTKTEVDELSDAIDALNKKSTFTTPTIITPNVPDFSSWLNPVPIKETTESMNNLGMCIDTTQDKLSKAKEIFGTFGTNLVSTKESTDSLISSTNDLKQAYSTLTTTTTPTLTFVGTSSYANVNAERERLLKESGRISEETSEALSNLGMSIDPLQAKLSNINDIFGIVGTNLTSTKESTDNLIDSQNKFSISLFNAGESCSVTKAKVDSLSSSIDDLNKKSIFTFVSPKITPPETSTISPQFDSFSIDKASQSISLLGDCLNPLQDKLSNINDIFGTPGGKDGLNARISYMGDSLTLPISKVQALNTNTQNLQTSASSLGDFLVNTFNKQIQSSTTALSNDESAANAAASAQERYNRAKQGATSSATK